MQRIYLGILASVLGSLLLLGWLLDQVSDSAQPQESESLQFYRQIHLGLARQLETSSAATLEQQLASLAKDYQLTLRLESATDLALPPALLEQLQQAAGLLLESEQGPYLVRRLQKHPQWLLQMHLPQPTQTSPSYDLLLTLVFYLGLAGMLLLWLLPLTRSLTRLNRAAAAFGQGELQVRVNSGQFSYLYQLEQSFNRMAGQIEQLVADNKLLAGSLSHDLRTPLACLRFGLEAAESSRDIDKVRTYLTRMDKELTNMEDMLAAFLEYASMQRHAMQLALQPIALDSLLIGLIEDCRPLADAKKVKISTDMQSELSAKIDRHWFYRALQNLLTNAIQYANSQVKITAMQQDEQLVLRIEDDGEGIPVDQQQQIFAPLVRLESSRTRQQAGYGLGLAIVKRVMEWHQWQVTTGNAELGGAAFILRYRRRASR